MHLIKFKHTCLRKLFKFSWSGQGVGQRVGTYRDNHFYLKIHAWKNFFLHTCARAQNHKNFLILNIFKNIWSKIAAAKNWHASFLGCGLSLTT